MSTCRHACTQQWKTESKINTILITVRLWVTFIFSWIQTINVSENLPCACHFILRNKIKVKEIRRLHTLRNSSLILPFIGATSPVTSDISFIDYKNTYRSIKSPLLWQTFHGETDFRSEMGVGGRDRARCTRSEMVCSPQTNNFENCYLPAISQGDTRKRFLCWCLGTSC
jgi:hypothetical protein